MSVKIQLCKHNQPEVFFTIFYPSTTSGTCGLYYNIFMIVIYNHNAIGQYYKTTIVDYDRS
jgi:hypothetical protein